MASQLTSSLLQELPGIYQENPFLGQFLLAFEKILLGLNDGVDIPQPETGQTPFFIQGIEESIALLPTLFDPQSTPTEFLSWLADWTTFTLQQEINPKKQREFIANIIHRYRYRGTKENLKRLLGIFVVGQHEIIESSTGELQIGVNSTLGVDTYLGGGEPHFFRVRLVLPQNLANDRATLDRQQKIAHALIDLEKPAHTIYELEVIYPNTIQIGRRSTIGVDTFLGNLPIESI